MFILALTLMAFCACNNQSTSGDRFKIEGEINGAEGKTLVFEHSGLQGIQVLDSMKLGANGTFTFSQPCPESPEFYRLRIGNDVINLAVDSTETITVKAAADKFATGYNVEGSDDSQKIKEITLKQIEMQNKVDILANALQNDQIPLGVYQDSVTNIVNRYKEELKSNYIFEAPNKPYAYFALFQQVGQYTIFDPLASRDDMRVFAAVATSLYTTYPNAARSQNLYNIVIKGMQNDRRSQGQEIQLPSESVMESGIINISLRDLSGNVHKLSDLKGKVVLLDFTVYQSDFSAEHNYMLRDIYEKYHDRGFEIYQISLDTDEHYWKLTADNLPWICVRDANGANSTIVSSYNVQSVPAIYFINRDGELYASTETTLEAAVKSLL